ncbi:MAG: hypothetical protein QOJ40_2384 [Verrucomicrobiota bacterium]
MRVLLDQGVPFRSAQLLRREGWDAVHAREINCLTAKGVRIRRLPLPPITKA